MKLLYTCCIIFYMISLWVNKEKTVEAVKKARKMFLNVLPSFLNIILIMTLILFVFPPTLLVSILSEEIEIMNIVVASIIGSIAIIPGFIAFPVAKILKDVGVSYGVLAGLTTSLMMVGFMTLSIEKNYYGKKLAIIRNLTSYFIALAVSFSMHLLL